MSYCTKLSISITQINEKQTNKTKQQQQQNKTKKQQQTNKGKKTQWVQ